MNRRLRVTFNSPAVLCFAIACAAVTLLGEITGQSSTALLFSTRTSSLADPLTYVRLFTHVLGHSGWRHLIGNLSFTILNRETLSDYYIILPGLSSYRRALYLDLGFFGTLREAMHEGLGEALRHIHLQNGTALREILLNVLLYVPLGYILSFVFPRKHRHVAVITLIGFLCSLATESAQLYWRIGYFHLDDIINNTLGTLIGAVIGCILAAVWRVA